VIPWLFNMVVLLPRTRPEHKNRDPKTRTEKIETETERTEILGIG